MFRTNRHRNEFSHVKSQLQIWKSSVNVKVPFLIRSEKNFKISHFLHTPTQERNDLSGKYQINILLNRGKFQQAL